VFVHVVVIEQSKATRQMNLITSACWRCYGGEDGNDGLAGCGTVQTRSSLLAF